jgi:hypothetical protein
MSSILWDITPCSPLKANRPFGGTYRIHLQGRRISRVRNQRESRSLVSCSAYSSTLKIDAICSSETLVDFQRTTRRYIPEDIASSTPFHNHRCENLKSYIFLIVFHVIFLTGSYFFNAAVLVAEIMQDLLGFRVWLRNSDTGVRLAWSRQYPLWHWEPFAGTDPTCNSLCVHGQARVNKFLTTLCYMPNTSHSGLARRWQNKQQSAYERVKYVLQTGAKISGYPLDMWYLF